MKKFRLICLLLCLLLTLQCMVMPGFATEAEDTTADTSETTTASEPTETTAPVIYDIPDAVTGDASVTSGCNSIDAQRPLSSESSVLKTTKSAVLYEMTTGTMVYAKNPDEQMYPASLTKIMTCLLALEMGNLDDMVKTSETAIEEISWDSTSIDLEPGEEMSLRNLLYSLMVESANDAANVIAEHIAGSKEAFADLMNKKAAQLGCTGTHFANAHGLHDENHYTTARGMAKITLAALEYDEFREIYSTGRYVVPETNLRGERILNSTNYLIANDIIDFYYEPLITGGKTGYTSAAGRCLVSTAESEESDMKLVCVILGAEEYINEDGNIEYYGSFEETVDVVKYGLYKFTTAELYHRGQVVGQFDVAGGENSVVGEPADSRRVLVRNDFKESDITFRTEVLNGGLNAPIAVGDKIGILRVWYKNVCIAQTDILSLSVSKKDTMNSIFDGGVITDEESDKITSSFNVGLKIFIGLVAVVVVLSVGVAVYNAVIEHKRRKRRRNRRRSR
jgi:D-alanyl-D-alanine carboxypeptidase